MNLMNNLKGLRKSPILTIGRPCPFRDMHICTDSCALWLEDDDIKDCTLRVLAKLLFDFGRTQQ